MPSAEVLAGFLRAHGLQLNAQQQAAVGAVEGAVLLLAVPGSGKTTVLVTRLGYLVQCCNVRPEEILTMTYTVAATRDMRSRFSSLFGEELGSRMEFRTINGVSARIIRAYEQRMGRTAFSLLSSEAEQTALLRVLYFRCKGEYPTDAELKQARTLIAYAKNQMLGKEELDLLWKELDCFPALYRAYQQALRNARQMDYDDQMVYALRILRQVPEILHEFQARYHYFCVDEAQDTSRIQHAIVSLLAGAGGTCFSSATRTRASTASAPPARICCCTLRRTTPAQRSCSSSRTTAPRRRSSRRPTASSARTPPAGTSTCSPSAPAARPSARSR